MRAATAFLSYTRKDDQFFGGYITAFRKSLEIGVHVVTGDESFRLFQDIDGIVIGEQWERKIADVIEESSFLIPMLSPLYFNSEPCRSEVELFLEHEKGLQRDDLILPVYFIEAPRLEKPAEAAQDRIATTINARHRFDWRQKANLPLESPSAREAVLELSRAISTAIERVDTRDAQSGPGASSLGRHADSDARALEAHRIGVEALANDSGGPLESRRKSLETREILWVDDRPQNNEWERRALEAYGMSFQLATSTEEAVRKVGAHTFAAIISDMGRPGDRDGGFTLLDLLRRTGVEAPYFIYCGTRAPRLQSEGQRRGASLVTNNPDELIAAVVAAVR